MNNYIKVVIKDDNGLCDVLLREGYSQAWIEQGKQIIVRQFKKTANRVFSHILDKYPPHTIWVGFKLDNTDDIFGKKRLVGASHYSVGDGTELFFELSKDLVKSVLEKGNHEGFKHLISHEMFHGADKKMIIANYKLVDAVQRSLRHDVEHRDALAALYEMLYVLYHFRDEGLAELGACMIGKQRKPKTAYAAKRFRMLFEMMMLKSMKRAQGDQKTEAIYDDDEFRLAYQIGPAMLVLVLEKRGEVTKELARKALEGLETGDYKLSDAEMKSILEAAMLLTLPDYIHGAVCLGPETVPIKPFLEFCAQVQDDLDNGHIHAFADFVELSKAPIIFDVVMEKIMGQAMAEDEIDSHYTVFLGLPDVETAHPKIKEKAQRLYDVMKNDGDPDDQRIARWALSYLFMECDVIHDDVKVVGYVDDLIVLDYALKVLEKKVYGVL